MARKRKAGEGLEDEVVGIIKDSEPLDHKTGTQEKLEVSKTGRRKLPKVTIIDHNRSGGDNIIIGQVNISGNLYFGKDD